MNLVDRLRDDMICGKLECDAAADEIENLRQQNQALSDSIGEERTPEIFSCGEAVDVLLRELPEGDTYRLWDAFRYVDEESQQLSVTIQVLTEGSMTPSADMNRKSAEIERLTKILETHPEQGA
jgi:hypothetical protein